MTAVPKELLSEFPIARKQADRRRNRRIAIRLKGRYLDELSEDKGLQTRNISCGGALIDSEHRPPIGARIVCYFDQLGRVAATVRRHVKSGFAIQFQTTQPKRDRLADKLIWLVNSGPLNLEDERRSQRHAASGPAIVKRENGREMQCRAVDISLTGASFNTDGPLPVIGEMVKVGNLYGTVVRSSQKFFAIRYLMKSETPEH